jgi:hypothetical protein
MNPNANIKAIPGFTNENATVKNDIASIIISAYIDIFISSLLRGEAKFYFNSADCIIFTSAVRDEQNSFHFKSAIFSKSH